MTAGPAWARALSIAGHPALLMPLAVAVAAQARQVGGDDLRTALGACLGVSGATMVYSLVQVRRGRWTHVDASQVPERRQLHLFLALLLLCVSVALHLAGAMPAVVAGLALSGGIVVGAVVGGWLVRGRPKASLHVAFALLAAGLAWPVPAVAVGIAMLALGVAASRLALGRHTRGEVLAGAALGLAAAATFHAALR